MNAQPARAPFDDMEMREVSLRKPDRPRRREFAPAEDPALQLERVQDVCENVGSSGLQRLRHSDLPSPQEDQSHLWATWAWILQRSLHYNWIPSWRRHCSRSSRTPRTSH